MQRKRFDPAVYLVTDPALGGARPLESIVRLAVEGGVTMVQVREKSAGTRAFLERARGLLAVTRDAGVPLIVNDRLDVALAIDADGVHVGDDDMPAAVARRLLGPRRILGVTAASPAAAERAERDGADYVGCSAVFGTPTKTDTGPPIGVEGLAALVAAVRLPVVAIGGIHSGNAADVLATGAAGLAVVSAICAAADPRAAARRLAEIVAERRTWSGAADAGQRPG